MVSQGLKLLISLEERRLSWFRSMALNTAYFKELDSK